MKWQDKLNKTDKKHLKETRARTLTQVKANVKHQETMAFPCWDCVGIGRKLGIDVNLKAFHELHKG